MPDQGPFNQNECTSMNPIESELPDESRLKTSGKRNNNTSII